ncbi:MULTISPECIES: FkbM family methyltransferase [unclassified Microcystis]|jgi:FkbM family methyltransferase|uniref:FkbM family methyltransferase n=1 Tax=Microcystis flos-aquae Mf_QC_C_20070823_S10D TaxID=2486236 RepID=A0A552KSE9_9CHRO|nr:MULTISPECIES: FkbM family methyltransferase [unclassified Microcystis]MCA2818977.1 FkbM family methyltransferase [Microcystis sp. M085S1]MCA2854995.1 FkbM family methyltransferase [Microcystis sp. M065S1]TRT74354.1 MAG: FkbM family methyltransferase [Microcystis flos-aquae Ma_QC_C_20070823_S18]TRU02079.1 MAG: FkbM family methyltransferase [Microcystis flos-aquae Ma_QC_C_20070823_S18D]TRV10917.1 MAG: FkbM family methyltransferase [Microcystis flos-aquae Mf_QC_C_20070823_S10D]TRV27436.1 MAG:
MFKKTIKKLSRSLGIDLKRYNIQTSEAAKMQRLLAYHNIDLVFDVGANIGQYAKLLRELGYSGRIVSFEPLSSAYSQLKAVSEKDPLWEIAPQTAIGNQEGEIVINIAGNSYSSSALPMLDAHLESAPESAYSGSETVKLSRLDTLAKDYIKSETKSIFLKIDVQGLEKQVLEGATAILPLVKGIKLELSLVPLYEGQVLFKEMIDIVEKLGYELYGIEPGFTAEKTGRMLQMDGIFFKPD